MTGKIWRQMWAILEGGNGRYELVGAHGQTMKYSVSAAYNFIRDNARKLGLSVAVMQSKKIIIHLVSIATPREGSSAELAFVIGMVSALSGLGVRASMAVTGDVSLHGEVSAVGGLPQKLAAAKSHGRRVVIVPRDNQRDVEQLDALLLESLEVIYVSSVTDALQAALQPIYRS